MKTSFHFNAVAKRTFRILGASMLGSYALLALALNSAPVMLPDAQDFLNKHGIDPQTASTLAGGRHLYLNLDEKRDTGGDQSVASSLTPAPIVDFFNICTLHIAAGRLSDLKAFISERTGIPLDQIENLPVSQKDMMSVILLHEIVHCDRTKHDPASEYNNEIHSDTEAAAAANAAGNPAAAGFLKMFRALDINHPTHTTALGLDAAEHGATHPPEGAIRAALLQLFDFEIRNAPELVKRELQTKTPDVAARVSLYRRSLDNPEIALPPMVRRTMALYVEGAQYFAPKLLSQARPLGQEIRSQPPKIS